MNTRRCRRCGRLTWSSRSPYCLAHRPPPEVRALWAAKSREARGYGAAHKRLRERFRILIDSGAVVVCARCRRRILPADPWDLGHVDGDRNRYAGPEHRACNRRAGAKIGAAITNQTRHPHWSREW